MRYLSLLTLTVFFLSLSSVSCNIAQGSLARLCDESDETRSDVPSVWRALDKVDCSCKQHRYCCELQDAVAKYDDAGRPHRHRLRRKLCSCVDEDESSDAKVSKCLVQAMRELRHHDFGESTADDYFGGLSFPPTPQPVPPTPSPTWYPTAAPTHGGTGSPVPSPTVAPTLVPTVAPSLPPTVNPTSSPTASPTWTPTLSPTLFPTFAPTAAPPPCIEESILTPPVGALGGEEFGSPVSVSGDTAIVGSVLGSGDEPVSGVAFVFFRTGTTWAIQQRVFASDGSPSDNFGHAVSVSGDTALICADLDDDFGTDSGSAYVFVRTGTMWTQQQKLTASDGLQGDRFGSSASAHGDTVVIGAGEADVGVPNSGAAYVFVRTGTTWALQQKLTASDGLQGDRFGNSVSVHVDTVVIGAAEVDEVASNAGSAYVFVRTGTTWVQQQKLTASDGQASDEFGFSVSVDGDTAVIGASGDDDGGSSAGSAYVFVRTGTTWVQQQKLTASDGQGTDEFGFSVSVSGTTTLVGTTRADAAYVYSCDQQE